MIRVLHTADWHLGVTGYGQMNPVSGQHQRLEDYLATIDQMVAYALANLIDVFLVSGDIYHTKTPDSTQQREFAKRVHVLVQAGILVVLLVGNHDAIGRENAANPLDLYTALDIPGVYVLREPAVTTIETRSGPVQVASLPHMSRSIIEARRTEMAEDMNASEHEMEAILGGIVTELAGRIDPTIPSVLAAHWAIDVALAGSEGQMMLGRGLTLSLAALQQPEFDYVAMGHIHKPQSWLGEGPLVAYPGSPDRVDFGEEDDEKGFLVVELEAGSATSVRVPLQVRPFVTIRPNLTDAEYPTDALVAAIGQVEVAGAVVRLAYTLKSDRVKQIDEARVREALASAFYVAWRPNILPAEARMRNPSLAASCAGDPLTSLGSYIDAMPELADRREVLLAAGAALCASLSGDPIGEVARA